MHEQKHIVRSYASDYLKTLTTPCLRTFLLFYNMSKHSHQLVLFLAQLQKMTVLIDHLQLQTSSPVLHPNDQSPIWKTLHCLGMHTRKPQIYQLPRLYYVSTVSAIAMFRPALSIICQFLCDD